MHSKDRINPFINRQPLKTGGREVFLERVRKGLGHPPDHSPAPATPPMRDESLIRQFAATDDSRIERWLAKAQGNTMTIHRAAAEAGAVRAALDACFASHKITRSILNAGEVGERFGLADYLAGKNITAVRWGEKECRETAFHCEASITDCRAGLADSGSLLVWSDAGFGRSSTLVIPVHVMLLPVSRIVPDMIDALDLAYRETAGKPGGDGRLPSNIVVINGPSKTADIEMNLVTGVHGPKYLYIIMIDRL